MSGIFGIKDAANVSVFELATNVPALYSDYANVSTNEWTADRIFATAKGVNAIAWDTNRESTLVVEMEVFDLKWIAMMAGSEMTSGAQEVAKREVVFASAAHTATLGRVPLLGSVQIMPLNPSDLLTHTGEAYTEVEESPEEAQFTINGSEIAFSESVPEGTPFAVYYLVMDANATTIEITADKFPSAFRIVADALIRERVTGTDQFVQIEYPNARPQSTFTITMSATEVTTLTATFDLFPNRDGKMAVYKILSETDGS